MSVDFCDYFWGEEHNGWNVLYQNMKQGLNASKELGEFFKEKVSIDEAYSKSLFKLANKANVTTEKGTLGPILTLLKVSLEKMSNIHLHMVSKIQDLVKDVMKYNDDLHKKQKVVKDEESGTEEVVRSIQATRALVQKAKEVYHQRCQDQEKLKRESASPKEVEKVEAKLRKAHDEYKALVDKYNSIRDDFEKKLLQSCQHFQIVEESHLSQVMLFAQTYIDILQADRSAMGLILHELASKYSQFTIDKLLNDFVLTKLTGLEKPVSIIFEDTSSLGSAISEQQSPEPGSDVCRSAVEETSSGGTERSLGSGVLTSAFLLRSRRDKRKDKKNSKRKKEGDSSSTKDEKSDNENSEDARTADLISMGDSKPAGDQEDNEDDGNFVHGHDVGLHNDHEISAAGLARPSAGLQVDNFETEEPIIDSDGYTIRPSQKAALARDASFDSSSDSDSEIGIEKKIHVKIKPLSNGAGPISASVDELRATIEGMTLSPLGTTPFRRSPSESQEHAGNRSSNITPQMRSSSADLLGLNFNFPLSVENGSQNSSSKEMDSNGAAFSPPVPLSAAKLSKSTDLTETDGNASDSAPPPLLPPRLSVSRESNSPTASIAIPRPVRKFESSRSLQSPVTVSGISRTESVSSLEFRTSVMHTGVSRGPSPLTLGMADTIPLAVAFQELCHAYFRGTDESRVQIKVTGEMMVSFPAGIVGVLLSNPSPAQLAFKIQNFSNISNVLPNKQLILHEESQSTPDCAVYSFNMSSLSALLQKQSEQNPSASYFNVDMIKYQVKCSKAVEYCPLHLVSYWRCEDDHTDLKIDYKYNDKALNSSPCPLLNISISVPVDGVVKDMHSKPAGQWLRDQQKAVWNMTELSHHSTDEGKGSLRAKFDVAAGPSTPATVSAQFNCEGTTLSGLEFVLNGAGYRVSLVKKRFVSGKYICDADAVLRHRYGVVQS